MSETHESSILEYADRNIIDIMKDNMLSEKILNEDYTKFLKDQIKAYMIELSHKNEQITSLIKLFEKNVNKTNMYVETMPKSSVRNVECDNDLQLIGNNSKVVNNNEVTDNHAPEYWDNNSNEEHENIDCNNFIVDRKWITERKKKRNDVVLHNTFTPLSFQPIMDDENNGDNDASDYSGDNVSHVQAATKPKKKSNVYVNQNPERDTKRYHNAKTIPGNSTYGDIVKDGKKVCILSDSICKRIILPKFNEHLRKKRAYKKCFDGANTKGLLHFASYVLENDKPDIVIINVGGNNMSKDKPIIVADDIMDIVHLCKMQGVEQTFVSGVTPKHGFQTKINELNRLLEGKQNESDFIYIDNTNILSSEHLWRDRVHLNDSGIAKLADNFITALNNDRYSG